jgi:hypothetical protein
MRRLALLVVALVIAAGAAGHARAHHAPPGYITSVDTL